MIKIFVVTEYIGRCRNVLGAFRSFDEAVDFRKGVLQGSLCKISRDKYEELVGKFWLNAADDAIIDAEKMFNIIHCDHPEYTVQDLWIADKYYGGYAEDLIDVDIEKTNLYNTAEEACK